MTDLEAPSFWDLVGESFDETVQNHVREATQWRPCAACIAAGGYDRDRWQRTKPDGSPAKDSGWPLEGHSHGRPEQIPPDTDWRMLVIRAGRGFGKALDVSTPVPTPDGWTTMGELVDGSIVLDEQGRPCRVLRAWERYEADTSAVVFADGTELVADGSHQWVTWTHAERKAWLRSGATRKTDLPPDWPRWRAWSGVGPRVRTTDQIAATLTQGKRGDRNHCIPMTAPLELPPVALPIDPYVLGVWLGDGSSKAGEITCHVDDFAHYRDQFAERGESLALPTASRAKGNTWTCAVSPAYKGMRRKASMTARLRALGVLNDKHVPGAYLRGSSEQRADLLRGLMDTDGYVSPESGHAEFTSTNRRLASAAIELVRSLGGAPVLAEGRATLNGVHVGTKYRVTWRPMICPASLPRKVAAWTGADGAQAFRSRHRMIVDVRPVGRRVVRCITVDSPNSLFLAGEAMVPTHNTRSYNEWLIERRLKYPGTYGALAMPTLKELRGIAFDGESGLVACLTNRGLREGVDYRYNRTLFEITLLGKNGAKDSKIQGFSSEAPEVGRGFQSHDLVVDEPGTFRDQHLPRDQQLYQNLKLGHRLPMPDGSPNREFIAGTPRRRPFVRELLAKVEALVLRGLGVLVTGSTRDNAGNLAGSFLEEILSLEGTQLGLQEIEGMLLGDVEGALWKQASIEAGRVAPALGFTETLQRRIISVDPAAGEAPTSDEVGIIGVGAKNRHAYVLGDWTTRGMPDVWADRVVDAAVAVGAHAVVVEQNLVGSWFTKTIKQAFEKRKLRCPIVPVRAGKGQTKEVRAEPIALLYSGDEPRVHHVGRFDRLEDEMTTWVPGESKRSPNRIDALAWGVTDLLLDAKGPASVAAAPGDQDWPDDLPTRITFAR